MTLRRLSTIAAMVCASGAIPSAEQQTSLSEVMSEMITENDDVRGQINVSYQSEPLVGLLVPIEMRERYTSPGYKATITGQATYGKFRQFQVQVDEKIGPIQ